MHVTEFRRNCHNLETKRKLCCASEMQRYVNRDEPDDAPPSATSLCILAKQWHRWWYSQLRRIARAGEGSENRSDSIEDRRGNVLDRFRLLWTIVLPGRLVANKAEVQGLGLLTKVCRSVAEPSTTCNAALFQFAYSNIRITKGHENATVRTGPAGAWESTNFCPDKHMYQVRGE
jgi:hypothetical protein